MTTGPRNLSDRIKNWWKYGETYLITTETRQTATIIDPPEPLKLEGTLQERTERKIQLAGSSLHTTHPKAWLKIITKERNPDKIQNNTLISFLVKIGDEHIIITKGATAKIRQEGGD